MRRLLLVFLAGFLLNIHVFAQWDDDDDYDYDDDFDQPAASAPTASTTPSSSSSSSKTDITVKNSGSEEVTEETLTLPNNQPIYLYFYNNVQNAPPVETAPVETKAETAPVEPVYTPPFFMEEKYNPPPPPPPSPPVEYRYIPTPPVEYWYIPPPQPPVEYRYIPPPVETPRVNIRVIPGLPDPNSRKVYRLQVGSYSVHSTADRMVQQLRAAGLQAGIEYYNSLQRVLVLGVRAADAASVVQTLGLMGFEEVWIRE
jgi:cell division protein FtsN